MPSMLRRFLRNRLAAAGAALAGLLILAALVGPILYGVGYDRQFPGEELLPPGGAHPLGTDQLGFDVLARALHGGRASLLIAVAATAISLAAALAVGLAAGCAGGWLDSGLMRVTDTFYAFPSVLLAMALVAVADHPSITLLFVALGATGWTGLARLVRAQVLAVRESEYVQAARALGLSPLRVALCHVLPNCLGPVAVAATLAVGSNILGEAGLSFLGLGVPAPYPSWGSMLAGSRSLFGDGPWLMLVPGAAIALAVLGFNLMGDGLRDALDPRSVESAGKS